MHFFCLFSDRDSIKILPNAESQGGDKKRQMNHFNLNPWKTALSWGCLCSGEVSHSWCEVGAPWDVYLITSSFLLFVYCLSTYWVTPSILNVHSNQAKFCWVVSKCIINQAAIIWGWAALFFFLYSSFYKSVLSVRGLFLYEQRYLEVMGVILSC